MSRQPMNAIAFPALLVEDSVDEGSLLWEEGMLRPDRYMDLCFYGTRVGWSLMFEQRDLS